MNLLDFPDEILLEIFSHTGYDGGPSNAIKTCKKIYSVKEDIFNAILKRCFPSNVPNNDYIPMIKLIVFNTDSITHSREIYPNDHDQIRINRLPYVDNIISVDKKLNWIISIGEYNYSIGDLPHICDGGFPVSVLPGDILCHSKDKIKIVYKTYRNGILRYIQSNDNFRIKMHQWILSITTTDGKYGKYYLKDLI